MRKSDDFRKVSPKLNIFDTIMLTNRRTGDLCKDGKCASMFPSITPPADFKKESSIYVDIDFI